jgi:GTP-binding protein YchF
MPLNIGLIGLPNVGKSTMFNALTKTQNALVANYPFATIEPNRAIVPVPDERVQGLQRLIGVPNAIHATIEFVDIAGLVRGASKGEGLGNQFLSHIRDVNAIVHVVRCFEDPNVVHISETPDPRADIEIVELELMLADLQSLERRLERLAREVKGDKKLQPVMEMAHAIQSYLEAGKPVSRYVADHDLANDETFADLDKEMRFLSNKPIIYAANVGEDDMGDAEAANVETIRALAEERHAEVVVISAKIEEEMAGFSEEERQEFLALSGIEESGLDQVIHHSFHLLDLITFFTMNEKEVRAWTVRQGTKAPQAAGTIHTDFERGFIRAEVIPYPVFVEHGSHAAVKAAGAMRLEGKEYVVHDGDVLYIRFHV